MTTHKHTLCRDKLNYGGLLGLLGLSSLVNKGQSGGYASFVNMNECLFCSKICQGLLGLSRLVSKGEGARKYSLCD